MCGASVSFITKNVGNIKRLQKYGFSNQNVSVFIIGIGILVMQMSESLDALKIGADFITFSFRLNLALIRDDIELLVKAIGGVCDPYILFENHLINIITAIKSGGRCFNRILHLLFVQF